MLRTNVRALVRMDNYTVDVRLNIIYRENLSTADESGKNYAIEGTLSKVNVPSSVGPSAGANMVLPRRI
jgi:hypothetical protein